MFDAVAEAHVNLKEVAGEDRAGWSTPAHSDRVREVFSLTERAEAELIRTLSGWDLAGGWEADGQRTAVCWLVWQVQIARPRAKVLIDSAVLCQQYDTIAAALAAGTIACAHVAALAKAEHGHAEEFAVCVEGLLGAADRTSAVEFDWVANQWANAVDKGKAADAKDRGLSIADTFGGRSYVKGHGSTEEAAILRRALLKDKPPDPADCPEGPRSLSDRMWDKLIDLGPRYCDAHHILPWPQGSLTDIDDGLLLCQRHHSIVHTKGWTLGRDPTTCIVTVTNPDGRTFSHRPTHLGRRP